MDHVVLYAVFWQHYIHVLSVKLLRRYERGQKYAAHFDVHGSREQQLLVKKRGERGGSRYATLLMFLSGVYSAGC